MSSRRRIPPEKVSSRRSAASSRSNAVEQVRRGLPGIGDVAQLAHQHQVLPGGEQVVHRGELSGHADVLADLGGCSATSNPATLAAPPSALINVVRMLMVVVLPEPLAPSSANTVPRSDREVDAVEDGCRAERLAQTGDGDGVDDTVREVGRLELVGHGYLRCEWWVIPTRP